MTDMRLGETVPKAECPVCHKQVGVTVGGFLYAHPAHWTRPAYCPGSGYHFRTPSASKIEVGEEHIVAVENAFRKMNWYASKKVYQGHRGVDPNEVLADVYYVLASVWTPLIRARSGTNMNIYDQIKDNDDMELVNIAPLEATALWGGSHEQCTARYVGLQKGTVRKKIAEMERCDTDKHAPLTPKEKEYLQALRESLK